MTSWFRLPDAGTLISMFDEPMTGVAGLLERAWQIVFTLSTSSRRLSSARLRLILKSAADAVPVKVSSEKLSSMRFLCIGLIGFNSTKVGVIGTSG